VQQACEVTAWTAYQSAVHSQTLPIAGGGTVKLIVDFGDEQLKIA